jgi:hypothetical protein
MEAYLNYEDWRLPIYGGQSFASAQMQWLAADLAAASGSAERVLFYHSDFSNQINLPSLGVGLTLSGHTHANTEDATYPYKIVTSSACKGKRSYRLVRVTNGVVQPQATIYAGSGLMLNVIYTPANNGTNYTVTANITNGQNQRFEHSQLRFLMPNEPGTVSVTGGTLLQVDTSGPHAVCYVGVDILASSSRTVTVTLTPAPAGVTADLGTPGRPVIIGSVPNPFGRRTAIRFGLPRDGWASLALYDVSGRRVAKIFEGHETAGYHEVDWANNGAAEPGLYFLRLQTDGADVTSKVVVTR